jgi:hypothetical protein
MKIPGGKVIKAKLDKTNSQMFIFAFVDSEKKLLLFDTMPRSKILFIFNLDKKDIFTAFYGKARSISFKKKINQVLTCHLPICLIEFFSTIANKTISLKFYFKS